ncbi:MAG TPA: ATP-binding protein, partial [Vicinamibacteria bacterium]|nr:ATP-binding protein [Vicinamibacteria bacterium]
LLGNAVKATSSGEVAVRVQARGAEALFSISDTGPGIPAEVRRNLFEPYWRGRDVSYRGTGLGLAITCGIVEAHGGRIWAESREGAGATFSFAIPIEGTAARRPL